MGIVSKACQGVKDFHNGLSIIFGKAKPGEGDRKLAKIGTIIESQVNSRNKYSIRNGIIKDIERVLRGEAKKGGKKAVDAKVGSAVATPEYMRMLRRLGLNESHLRVMAMEALKKYAK